MYHVVLNEGEISVLIESTFLAGQIFQKNFPAASNVNPTIH